MKSYQSKEIQFLASIIESEGIEKIKHPIVGTLLGQVTKLLGLLDSNEEALQRIKNILNRIKEEWNDNTDC